MQTKTSILKGFGLVLAAFVSVLAIQLITSTSTFAAVKTWTGGGGDGKFSTGANWGGSAPSNGDSLVFPTVGSPQTLNNDQNSGGTTYVGVTVSGTTNYSIDDLTLSTGTVAVTSSGTLTVTNGLASNPGSLTLNGNGKLVLNSVTPATDLNISSSFSASSVTLNGGTIASMSSAFSVSGTLHTANSLTISQAATIGILDVTGTLTANANFTATTTGAGAFVVGSDFNGGAITSYASFTTGAHAVTATTFRSNGATVDLTVSASGTLNASTSVTVDRTLTNSGTINTPLINIVGTTTSVLGGTFSQASNVNSPNGPLTISTTSTLGAVTTSGTAGFGDVNASGAFTATSLNVSGALTVGANFTSGTTSAGSFVVNSSFTGGAITSFAAFTTGANTVTGTTFATSGANIPVTVSASGSLATTTSVTLSGDLTGTGTINTATITANGAGISTIAGALAHVTTNVNVPNGSLTLSTTSANVGAVVVGTNVTASGAFTAVSISAGGVLAANAAFTSGSATADTITMTSAFTVNGNLTSNSASTPLVISRVITGVTTLDAKDDLTVSAGGSIAASVLVKVAGNLTTAASTTVSAPTVTVTGTATLSAALTATTLISINGVITLNAGSSLSATLAGTITTLSNFTASQSVTAATLNVAGTLTISGGTFNATTINVTSITGNLVASVNYTSTTVNVSQNATVTGSQSSVHKYVVAGTMTVGDGSSSTSITFGDTSAVTGIVTVKAFGTVIQSNNFTVDFGGLVVENSGTARLFGTVTYPVTFGSGASAASPSLAYNSGTSTGTDADNISQYNTLKFTGAVTLLNDLQLQITGYASTGIIEFAGPLTYNGFVIRKSVSTSGTLIVNGVEVRNPTSTSQYDGDLPGTSVSAGDNEIAVIAGNRGTVTGYRGSLIKGTGKVVNLNLAYGATVSPGNSPGKLTVLNILNLGLNASINQPIGGTYYAEVKSTTEYDQLAVGSQYASPSGSPVVLSGSGWSGLLNVVLSSGFKIAQGDKFTIIDNQSTRPVSGTFKNMAEGSVFSVADGIFSISYVGGDGNDVVLTVVSAPSVPAKAPNTGFKMLTSNPQLMMIVGVIAAGFFIVLAIRHRINS